MGRFEKIFLYILILLAIFATNLPRENTAVLCFSHTGDIAIRENDHSLCKDSHEEMSSISLEKDSHDHCNDVVIPSFAAKTQAFKFTEPLIVDSGLNLIVTFFTKNTFFKTVFKPKNQEDFNKSRHLNVISKTIFIC